VGILPCSIYVSGMFQLGRKVASVDKKRQKAANTRTTTRCGRRTGYAQIDGRLLELLDALLQELRARRESELEPIDWDNVKVGGTD
jgi:hypothetical protein